MIRIIILLIAHLSYQFCFGQNIDIIGKVVNQMGEPLAYTNIHLLRTNHGVITNENGEFRFILNDKYISNNLRISHLGYKSAELKIVDCIEKSSITVKMLNDIVSIDEINVTPTDALYLIKKAIKLIPENYMQKPFIEQTFYRELIKEDDTYIGIGELIAEIQNFPGVFPINVNWSEMRHFSEIQNKSELFHPELFFLFWSGFAYTANEDYIKHKAVRNNNFCYKSHLKPVLPGISLGLRSANWVANPSVYSFLYEKKFNEYEYHYDSIVRFSDRNVYAISVSPKNIDQGLWEGKVYIDCKSYAFVHLKFWLNKHIKTFLLNRNPALFSKEQQYEDNYVNHCTMLTEVFYKPIGKYWSLSHIKRNGTTSLNFSEDYLYPESRKIQYSYEQILQVNNIIEDTIMKEELDTQKNKEATALSLFSSNYADNRNLWSDINSIYPTSIEDSVKQDLEKRESLEKQFVNNGSFIDTLPPPKAKKINFTHNTPTGEILDPYFWMENLSDSSVMRYIDSENDYAGNFLIKSKPIYLQLLQEAYLRNSKSKKKASYKDTIFLEDKFNLERSNFFFLDENLGNICLLRKNEQNKIDTIFQTQNNIKIRGKVPAYLSSSPSGRYLGCLFTDIAENITFAIRDLESNQWVYVNSSKIDSFIWNKSNDVLFFIVSNEKEESLYSINVAKNNTTQKLLRVCHPETIDYVTSKKSVLFKHSYPKGQSFLSLVNNHDSALTEIFPFQHGYFSNLKQIGEYTILSQVDTSGNTKIIVYDLESREIGSYAPKNDFFIKTKGWLADDQKIAIVESSSMIDRIRLFHLPSMKSELITPTLCDKFQEIQLKKLNRDSLLFDVIPAYKGMQEMAYCFSNEQTIILRENRMSGFFSGNYKIMRKDIRIHSGIKVPVVFIAKKGVIKPIIRSRSHPIVLDVYGSYGAINRPTLSASDLSLLDRGVILASVHVRGGGELGPKWHIAGRGQNKFNTVTDFIKCTRKLIRKRYASKGLVVAKGTSAGGIPVGAAINIAPQLYHTAIFKFAALNNTNELLRPEQFSNRMEFGSPMDAAEMKNLLGFDPYYNLKSQAYPNVIVINSLNDPRVSYWQGLKYMARLRNLDTGNKKKILKTIYRSGHFGGETKNDIDSIINSIFFNLLN